MSGSTGRTLRDVLAGLGTGAGVSAVLDASSRVGEKLLELRPLPERETKLELARLRSENEDMAQRIEELIGERDYARERARFWYGEASRLKAQVQSCQCEVIP